MSRPGRTAAGLGTIAAMVVIALGLINAPRVAQAQMSMTRTALQTDTVGAQRAAKSDKRNFVQAQQNNERVLEARLEKRFELKKLFREHGLTYPAAEVFVRIFKRERQLELWARPGGRDAFTLLKTYSICALAGRLGPKRAQGDGQTPEGFYHIDGFNPASDFHLSLHLDYPNKSDQLLSSTDELGGNIFIHGGCRTEGCLAVTDDAIKELYWLAVEAQKVGQRRIPVHIFPTRLTDRELQRLTQVFDKQPELKRFWANLRPMYEYFETTHKLPLLAIDDRGRYRIQPQLGAPLPAATTWSARRPTAVPIVIFDSAHPGVPVLRVVADSVRRLKVVPASN